MRKNAERLLRLAAVAIAAHFLSRGEGEFAPGPAGGLWPLVFAGLCMAIRPDLMGLVIVAWLGLLVALWGLEARDSKPPSLLGGVVFGAIAIGLLKDFGPEGMIFGSAAAYALALILDIRNELKFRNRHGFYGTVMESRNLALIRDAQATLRARQIPCFIRGYQTACLRRPFALTESLELLVDGEDLESAQHALALIPLKTTVDEEESAHTDYQNEYEADKDEDGHV